MTEEWGSLCDGGAAKVCVAEEIKALELNTVSVSIISLPHRSLARGLALAPWRMWFPSRVPCFPHQLSPRLYPQYPKGSL